MNLCVMVLGDPQRFLALARFEHRVPMACQHCASDPTDLWLIFDQQNRLAAAERAGLARRQVTVVGYVVGSWQKDFEGRAVVRFALDEDGAAALFDDAVDRGEAEPRALAKLFGGKERFEQVF